MRRPGSSPPRSMLKQHPQATDLSRLIAHALSLDVARAGLDSHDLPFGVVLMQGGELRTVGHAPGAPLEGVIEQIEAQIWSLRPVLRACARCCHVDLRMPDQASMSALRVQLEHVNGPPLDAYLPLVDDGGWWVEAGSAWVLPSVGSQPHHDG